MHNSLNNLIEIQKEIQLKISQANNFTKQPQVIAVSKTRPIAEILPLINYGHLHFGENKVQESIEKWGNIKSDFNNLNLHMIGKLQTNKVKYAISLFDYIHSLDNIKLAEKIANEQIKQKKNIKLFIQINLGDESQKSGISILEARDFYNKCTRELNLNILGFMCLPPNNNQVSQYFLKMKNLTVSMKLKELSMGMSNDYLEAIKFQSSYLRIGSKIFGQRNQ